MRGGGLIRTVEQVYDKGLYWIIVSLFYPVTLWIVSSLTSRMTPFMNNLSLAETIGQIYGKWPRIITALSSVCCSIAGIVIQVTVITKVIAMCIHGVNPTILAVMATLIVIFYSTFGGIGAVTITDVLQCITFVLIIPGLAWLMFRKSNQSFIEIFSALASYENFQFRHVFQWNKQSIQIFFIGLTCTIGYIVPSIFQRIYMSSNIIQARKVFLFSSIFDLCITSIIVLIGIFVFLADPNLSITAIWPAITTDLAPVFKGLLAISLLAMAMSTADSSLNACSVMVTHDILSTLTHSKISSILQLRLARVISFVIGGLAMFLTFYKKDLLVLLLLGQTCFIPVVTTPLLLAIFGFRSSSRTALIGMGAGVLSILLWKKYLPELEGAFPAMLANGIAMLIAYYSLPRTSDEGLEKPSLEYQ